MAQGAGDLGVAASAEQREQAVAERGERLGRGAAIGLAGVFAPGDIADVVQPVLNRPVPPPGGFERRRQHGRW